ncbi:MAG TPA: hypothetical protein VIO33_15495 [Burkholderiaceae bacterium]
MFDRTAFLAASLTLALCGCAAIQTGIPAGNAPGLAAGWQDHSRPLINRGAGPWPGTTIWYVPGALPAGRYEVIRRDGDNARLVEGHAFTVEVGSNAEQLVILPMSYGRIEAVDVRYVMTAGSARPMP